VLIGAAVWLAFLGYVVLLGRLAHEDGKSADLDESLGEALVPTA
jgi:hypothetical protein